jgi:hypothetical protein
MPWLRYPGVDVKDAEAVETPKRAVADTTPRSIPVGGI